MTVTRYAQQAGAVLAYDGYADVVSEGPLGATYDVVYCEETASDVFLSESAWNILTGDDLDLEPGTAATVYDRNGDSSGAGNSISLVTNHLTGEQLAVTPAEPPAQHLPSGIPGAGRRGLCPHHPGPAR